MGELRQEEKSLLQIKQFFQQIELQFQGSIDSQLTHFIEANQERLNEIVDQELRQKVQDVFENLTRIPFISNSNLFKDFFKIETVKSEERSQSPFSKGDETPMRSMDQHIDDSGSTQGNNVLFNNFMQIQNQVYRERANSSFRASVLN